MADEFEDELISTAAQVLKHAADAAAVPFNPSQLGPIPDKKRTEVRPSPEERGTLLPIGIPKGGYTTEPGSLARMSEMAAVPEILHGPYKAFTKLHDYLQKGGHPTDEDAVNLSVEVATGVLGGTAFTHASREGLAAIKGLGKEVAEPTRFEKSMWEVWGKGKKEIAEKEIADPYLAYTEKELANLTSTEKELIDLAHAQEKLKNAMEKEGKELTDAIKKHLPAPTQLDRNEFASELYISVEGGNVGSDFKRDIDEVAGFIKTGEMTIHEAMETPYPHVKAHLLTLLSDMKHGGLVPKEEVMGKARELPDQLKKMDSISKDLGFDHFSEKIFVDAKPTYVGDFIAKNMDNDDIMDTIKLAKKSGVSQVIIGGGASPEIVIQFAPSKIAGQIPLKPPKNLPTELEMRNWPNAKPIENLALDEAHPGPIIAYHGTSAETYTKMDISKTRDIGHHFGTKEQASNRVGENADNISTSTTRIIPAFLDVKKPITLPDLGAWHPASLARHIEQINPAAKGLIDKVHHTMYDSAEAAAFTAGDRSAHDRGYDVIRKNLDKLGYDSIRYENVVEGRGWSYIVWQRDKIKSATDPDHILYVKTGPGIPLNREDQKDMAGIPREDELPLDPGADPAAVSPMTDKPVDWQSDSERQALDRLRQSIEKEGAASAPRDLTASSVDPSTGTAATKAPDLIGRMFSPDIAKLPPEQRAATLLKEQGMDADLGTFMRKQLEAAQQPHNVRGMLRGVGAAGGGMAGAASPMPGGTVLGTMIGSMTGQYLADVYDSFYQTQKATGEKPAILESHLNNLKGALIDGTVTGGTQVALPLVVGPGKALLSKLLRLPPNSAELLKEASDIGVDIGAANMAGSRAVGAVNIFGRMPFIGGSAQNAAKLQAKQLVAAHNDLFGKIANPRAASEISHEAFEEGSKRFTEFATKIQRQAEHAARVGEEAGAIIPAGGIKKAAQTAIDTLESKVGGIRVYLDPKEIKLLKSIVAGPDDITTLDAKAFDPYLENMIRKASGRTGLAMPMLSDIRTATSTALKSVDHPAAKLMAKVDADFKNGMRTFATDTAKNIGQFEREVFATGKTLPGRKTADEIADTIAELTTPTKVAEMRRLVGDDPIKQVARLKLDAAWQKAVISEEGEAFKWSADKFNKALGLDSVGGQKSEALREMLKGTGVRIEDIQKLASVADSVATAPIADVSTFMARAAVLRGSAGITDALRGALTFGMAGGGAASAGLPTTIAAMVVARYGVGSLMRPGMIDAATISMDKMATQAAKIAALEHMFTTIPEKLEDLLDEYMPPELQKGIKKAAGPQQ